MILYLHIIYINLYMIFPFIYHFIYFPIITFIYPSIYLLLFLCPPYKSVLVVSIKIIKMMYHFISKVILSVWHKQATLKS